MESHFNFLRVKGGWTYFARLAVVSDAGIDGVQLSAEDVSENPHLAKKWMEAARLGAEKALQAHLESGGTRLGLMIMSVLGTEVDTTCNAVEVASYCAAWKALGHSETELAIEFDQEWRIKRME